MNSVVYEIPGQQMYPGARSGGLSSLGHKFDKIDNIYVIGGLEKRFLLITTSSGMSLAELETLDARVKSLIPVARRDQSLQVEATQLFLDSKNKKETGVKALMFFDRKTFV